MSDRSNEDNGSKSHTEFPEFQTPDENQFTLNGGTYYMNEHESHHEHNKDRQDGGEGSGFGGFRETKIFDSSVFQFIVVVILSLMVIGWFVNTTAEKWVVGLITTYSPYREDKKSIDSRLANLETAVQDTNTAFKNLQQSDERQNVRLERIDSNIQQLLDMANESRKKGK